MSEFCKNSAGFEQRLRKQLMASPEVTTETQYHQHMEAVAWYKVSAPIESDALPARPIYQYFLRQKRRRAGYDFEPCQPSDPQVGSRLIGVMPVLRVFDPDGEEVLNLIEAGEDPYLWLEAQLESHPTLAAVARPIADEISGMYVFLDLRRREAVRRRYAYQVQMVLAFKGL